MQRAIDYIEDHLQEILNTKALAQAAGYSEYHFLRMFKDITKLTPGEYIRKRRISEIVRRMSEGKASITELAFEYGFQSKENFCRAFKREHHILPTDFRAAQNSLKLYGKLQLEAQTVRLKPELMELKAFRVVAFPSDEAFPPHFWNKYNAKGLSKRLTAGKDTEDYGISIWNAALKRLDYYIGVPEAEAVRETAGTVVIEIPQGLYAVFQTPPSDSFDFVNNIHRTWDMILREWLPQSGFRLVNGPEFETYLEQSRTYREKIYIPVEAKE